MPHLKIEYSANLDPYTDMGALCTTLAGVLASLQDDQGQKVMPLHGIRVLAYPAPHHAVADGHPNRAFVYLNLRMAGGRSAAVQKDAGEAILAAASAHLAPVFAQMPVGMTVQIDEGQHVYDGKSNNLLAALKA